MRALHNEIIVANHRLPTLMCGAVNHDIFAENIVIANNQLGFLTNKLEVLGQSTKHCALMHLVIVTHFSTAKQANERENNTVFANLYIVFDIHKRENLSAIAYLCLGRYDGLRTYITCHSLMFVLN